MIHKDVGILSESLKGRNTLMFIVGVDIAKRNHEAIIIDREGNIVKKAFNFKNDAIGFSKFKATLQSVSKDPSDFIIGMESTSHYWLALYSALKREGYPVHVLNPSNLTLCAECISDK